MNPSRPIRAVSRFVHSMFLRSRMYLPRQNCLAFTALPVGRQSGISSVFVINLERQPVRWTNARRELDRVLDATGKPLSERVIRYSACDAQANPQELLTSADVEPFYTLADQLFVEPQPRALPDAFDLVRPIRMSDAEVAVARSHIGVWRAIAQSDAPYALVLEDDIWFDRRFGRIVDHGWREIEATDRTNPTFDMLYLSYKEVRHGAPKQLMSKNVFRPERGLWYMSGYVLSKKGAQKLLSFLPCRGPVDLWINHKFRQMNVRALRRSVIHQRSDLHSTNSYSILPALSRIGVLDGGVALFHQRPTHSPVFAFGPQGSGLSSLAMALSMLGYRCCSDLDQIPEREFGSLLTGRTDRVFDAYVNIDSLRPHVRALTHRYPRAKFIVLDDVGGLIAALDGADLIRLHGQDANAWRRLCEHLRLAPPNTAYPVVPDIGQQMYRDAPRETVAARPLKRLRYDRSPWVVKPRAGWTGISASAVARPELPGVSRVRFEDELTNIQQDRWLLRTDTFPGNLGLFRSTNVNARQGGGLALSVAEELLGVRNLSAAAVSSRDCFLFGRFEATLQATNVPGLVTGFFLHRDSPRQEIDIEIAGNRPDRLLVNVFYNPGTEGARFDYGYRGTPVRIPLGFDASKDLHRFAIEWDPCEIRWLVDDRLVHRRAIWDPTPIPHLPMTLHVNTWPTRSRELAGRLALRALPASAVVRRLVVDAINAAAQPQPTSASEMCVERVRGSATARSGR